MRRSDSQPRPSFGKDSGRIRFARSDALKTGTKVRKKQRFQEKADSEPSLAGQLVRLGFRGLGRLARLTLIAAATLVGLGLLAAVLVAGYLYLSKSDYFTIQTINISGLEQTDGAAVKAAAGLDREVSIWSFDAEAAEAEIGALPWMAEVRVTKKWPDTVTIDVREHRPRVLVNLGRLYYMNDLGEPFRELAAGENPDLPIVSGFSEDDLMSPGPRVRSAIKEVFWLVDTLAGRSDEFKLDNISEINYDMVRGLTLFTRSGGLEVKIGFGSYEEKFRRLGRVMAHLKTRGKDEGLVYINLEASPRVTVRYDNSRSGPTSAVTDGPGFTGRVLAAGPGPDRTAASFSDKNYGAVGLPPGRTG